MEFKADGGFKHLVPGSAYVVIKEFIDYDGRVHPVGEQWVFRRVSFVPYYDGLTLFVQFGSGSELGVRLEWADHGQGAIVDALEEYVGAQAGASQQPAM